MANLLKKLVRNGVEYQIGDGTITLKYDDETIGTFSTNQIGNKTITIPTGQTNSVTEQFVRSMIYAGVGDYDNMFRATSGLYKILNALDEDDNLGLTEGEVWEDIVSSQTSISMISHSYSAMVCIASSKVAMDAILASSTATNEMSECWNSIQVIADSALGAELYLSSANGITALFNYQTAQDAFFSDATKKQQIVNQYIMTIVNNNTLLSNLYTDSVVSNAIVNSQEALNAIAGNATKLGIVDDSSAIMNAIATNSGALGNMSNANFTTYILENSTYLTTTTGSTPGQNRINAMDADDLLPAIFYWTGLSGYASFEALSQSDSAMAVVETNSESMMIIECNEEAMGYIGYIPNENTQAFFKLDGNFNDSSGNERNATVSQRTLQSKGVAYSNASNSTFVFSCPRKNTRTVVMRVKAGGSSSSWRNLSYIGGQNSGYYHGIFQNNSNRWDLTVKDGLDAISNVSVDTNWHLIVATFSSGSSKLYLDKELIVTNTSSIGTGNNNGYLFSKNGNEAFLGYIGETIIEEGIRTQTQIDKYYELMKKYYT